jgi:hypothetical protein
VERRGGGRRRSDLEVPVLGWSEFGRAGAAVEARSGRRWRLPRLWSLWFTTHAVGRCGVALVAVNLVSGGHRGGWLVAVNPPPWCRHSFHR